MNGVWHHYDGLWERNSRGQGLQKCTEKPSTPSSFLLSHCVYIFEKILVIRALAWRSGDPGFKTRSDHSLNLFLVVPGSTSQLHL